MQSRDDVLELTQAFININPNALSINVKVNPSAKALLVLHNTKTNNAKVLGLILILMFKTLAFFYY